MLYEEKILEYLKAVTSGQLTAEVITKEYLSKRGLITVLFDEFKEQPSEDKRYLAHLLNCLKSTAQFERERLL